MRNHAHSNRYYNGIRKDFVSQGSPSSTLVTRRIISFFFPKLVKMLSPKNTHIHTNRSWPFFPLQTIWWWLPTRGCVYTWINAYNSSTEKKRKRPGRRGLIEPLGVTTELYRGRGIWDRNTTNIYTPLALTTMMCEREKWRKKKERDSAGVIEREPCFVFRLSHQDPHTHSQ